MSKAELITVEVPEGEPPQTLPVEPSARLPSEEVKVSPLEEKDMDDFADGMYASFPESFWGKMEPPELRPSLEVRKARFSKRFKPILSLPHMQWIKASLASTGQMMGVAGWMAPGCDLYNPWRRSAVTHYKLAEREGWTSAEVEEMWAGTDHKAWDTSFDEFDEIRKEVLGDEPHWFLAPLFVYPEFQGRGVGKILMDWAIVQADQTDPPTPMYLEAAPNARPVYLHCGFVPCGKMAPAIVETDAMPKPFPVMPFSAAVKHNGTIYGSGNIGMDAKTNKLVEGDIKDRTRAIMNIIKGVLEDSGSKLDNIIKANVYLTDMKDFGAMNEAYLEFFKDYKPARTCVQVAALPLGTDIEIEFVAAQ